MDLEPFSFAAAFGSSSTSSSSASSSTSTSASSSNPSSSAPLSSSSSSLSSSASSAISSSILSSVERCLSSCSVSSYDPSIVLLLSEWIHSYVHSLLIHSEDYRSHSFTHSQIESSDMEESISMHSSLHYQICPPRELLYEISRQRNSIPLDIISSRPLPLQDKLQRIHGTIGKIKIEKNEEKLKKLLNFDLRKTLEEIRKRAREEKEEEERAKKKMMEIAAGQQQQLQNAVQVNSSAAVNLTQSAAANNSAGEAMEVETTAMPPLAAAVPILDGLPATNNELLR